jgi:hypothetical protein
VGIAMTDSEGRRRQVLALMARFNKLGEMLPSEDAVRDDEDERATARLILDEMGAVRAQIDGLIDAENESRCTSKVSRAPAY